MGWKSFVCLQEAITCALLCFVNTRSQFTTYGKSTSKLNVIVIYAIRWFRTLEGNHSQWKTLVTTIQVVDTASLSNKKSSTKMDAKA